MNKCGLLLLYLVDLPKKLLLHSKLRITLAPEEPISKLFFLLGLTIVLGLGCLQKFGQRIVRQLLLLSFLLCLDFRVALLEDSDLGNFRVVDDSLE